MLQYNRKSNNNEGFLAKFIGQFYPDA